MMVMTVLEAKVEQQDWKTLAAEYKSAVQQLDPGMVQTALVHSTKDSAVWQIQTLWESREALDVMRQTNQTPRGVLIFRAANAQPSLTIFEVTAQAVRQAA